MIITLRNARCVLRLRALSVTSQASELYLTFDPYMKRNMHAYKELSRAIGEERLMIRSGEPGGMEASRAGKMKSRRMNKGGEPKFVQVMAGHKEFLSKS